MFKPDHLTLGEQIGEGGFAIVRRADFVKALAASLSRLSRSSSPSIATLASRYGSVRDSASARSAAAATRVWSARVSAKRSPKSSAA